MQVSEGIHRLTQGVTNFYLISESGKYTVVDAGTPGDWAYFASSLDGLGATLADVDAVLLTHAHPDHTGFAERARTEAGAQVWIHRADEQAARTGKTGKRDGKITSYLLRAAFYRTSLSLLRRGGGRMIPIVEVSTFGDGEQIDVPGRPRAVHAPGHTPGSAALLFEDRRILVTGDVLATENALTGRIGPQIMPYGLNEDGAQALASLDALLGIEADLLLPGHGDPWTEGVAEAVRRAKAAGRSLTARRIRRQWCSRYPGREAGPLPGPGGWSVAVQDLGFVLVPRGGGPVGVQDEGPAPPVDDDLVVERTQQHAVLHRGLAAVGLVLRVVHLAGPGGLGAAAGPLAVPVPQQHRVADARRDGLGVPDVQRQARPGQADAELPAPQERREPARAGQQVDGLADHRLLDARPRPRPARRRVAGRPVRRRAGPGPPARPR